MCPRCLNPQCPPESVQSLFSIRHAALVLCFMSLVPLLLDSVAYMEYDHILTCPSFLTSLQCGLWHHHLLETAFLPNGGLFQGPSIICRPWTHFLSWHLCSYCMISASFPSVTWHSFLWKSSWKSPSSYVWVRALQLEGTNLWCHIGLTFSVLLLWSVLIWYLRLNKNGSSHNCELDKSFEFFWLHLILIKLVR